MKNLFTKSLFAISLAAMTISISTNALSADATRSVSGALSLERVYSDPPISGSLALLTKLSPDGSLMTYLKPKADNAMVQDLWAVSVKGGKPFVLLDADKLSDSNKQLSQEEIARRERMRISARGVVSYQWDTEGRFILVPLDGDVYAIDAKTREIKRLTDTKDDEIDPRLSADGKMLGFVRDGQLFVKNLASNQEIAVSPAKSGDISYGTSEFIAQEELSRFQGYWFAPDSKSLVYQKTDETRVGIIERMIIDAEGAKTVTQKYPFAGKENAIVELYIKPLNGGDAVKLDLGANDDFYIARVDWAKDSKSIYVQKLSRNQQSLELIKFNPTDGKGKVILTETSNSWVEVNNDFKLLKNGDFTWTSERDGYNHIYLYDGNGKLIRRITDGKFVVKSIKAVNEANDFLYFEASVDTPIENNLYAIGLRKDLPLKQITKSGGWWSTEMAKSGTAFIGNYSDPVTPPNAALYAADGKKLLDINANKLDKSHPYFAYKDRYSAPEFGIIKSVDGQDLYYSMLKPVGFDASKKYPVVVSIYGGPASARVKKTWVDPSLRLLQEKGFIVFTLDNRGTPDRDTKFTRSIYRQFGGPDIDDQIAGAKYLQSLAYVDKDNIGITGWSQGGFVTLMALSAKDTPFKAGAAGAPPTDWALYDTAFTERYMDTPQNNHEGYAASDVLNRIGNIKPNSLLLAQGMADDNVLMQNSTRVAAELQKRGVPFEMMFYPGQHHGLKGYERRKFQWNLMTDFFERKLKAK